MLEWIPLNYYILAALLNFVTSSAMAGLVSLQRVHVLPQTESFLSLSRRLQDGPYAIFCGCAQEMQEQQKSGCER